MEEIVIEKNIPISDFLPRRGTIKGTLQVMEVGDSILVPKDRRAAFAATAMRLSPKKFVSRSVEGNQVRFWRIE